VPDGKIRIGLTDSHNFALVGQYLSKGIVREKVIDHAGVNNIIKKAAK
jgi:hypothetical protein